MAKKRKKTKKSKKSTKKVLTGAKEKIFIDGQDGRVELSMHTLENTKTDFCSMGTNLTGKIVVHGDISEVESLREQDSLVEPVDAPALHHVVVSSVVTEQNQEPVPTPVKKKPWWKFW